MASAASKVALVLETMRSHPDGASVGEIAHVMGVTREAATRFLKSLVHEQLLDYEQRTDLYFLGVRLIGIGSAAAARIGPVDGLYDPMLRFSREFRVPVMFSHTRGADTFVLFRAQPAQFGAVIVPLGHTRPTHATAAGRVSLAFGNQEMLADVERAGMRKYTDRTVHTMEELHAELERASRQGYLAASEEINVGQHVIAVPVLNHRRRALACLAVSLIDRVQFERQQQELVTELQRLSQSASQLFTYGHGMLHAV